jgi:hypothetical protein
MKAILISKDILEKKEITYEEIVALIALQESYDFTFKDEIIKDIRSPIRTEYLLCLILLLTITLLLEIKTSDCCNLFTKPILTIKTFNLSSSLHKTEPNLLLKIILDL